MSTDELQLFAEAKPIVHRPDRDEEDGRVYKLKSLPPSDDRGYLVEIADVQKRTSKNGRYYLCVIYKVIDIVPSWQDNWYHSENFWLFTEDGRPLPEEKDKPSPYYFFYDLCEACQKQSIKSAAELIGSSLRIVIEANPQQPKYTNVVGRWKVSKQVLADKEMAGVVSKKADDDLPF